MLKQNLSNKNRKNFKGLSGIYKITNIKTREFYIGSSKDLGIRYTQWRYNFKIYILEDFEFEIIELLPPIKDKLWEREQYWVDNLKPTLNKDIKNVKGETKHLKEYKGENHSKFGKPAINRKPVLQFDLQGNLIKEWDYISQVTDFGFDYKHIIKCCQGKHKTHKGYIWKYKD